MMITTTARTLAFVLAATFAMLVAAPAAQAATITTEKYLPINDADGATWDHFTTISNLSNNDYIDQSQSTWTDNGDAGTSSTSGQSIIHTKTGAGGTLLVLNNGVGQDAETGTNAQSLWATKYLIDLGSVQNVAEFNSYSWWNGERQDQGYTLYSSETLDTFPAPWTFGSDFLGDPVTAGWTDLGTVLTNYYTGVAPNNVFNQVGVSFTGVGTARYLLVDISLGDPSDTFMGEFDVVLVAAVPEPSAIILLGTGLLGLCVSRRRRRRS